MRLITSSSKAVKVPVIKKCWNHKLKKSLPVHSRLLRKNVWRRTSRKQVISHVASVALLPVSSGYYPGSNWWKCWHLDQSLQERWVVQKFQGSHPGAEWSILWVWAGQLLMSKWKYQFLYDHWSQPSWAQSSFQIDWTFWGVGSASVEQSRCNANMVCSGRREIRPLRMTPEFLRNKQSLWEPAWQIHEYESMEHLYFITDNRVQGRSPVSWSSTSCLHFIVLVSARTTG